VSYHDRKGFLADAEERGEAYAIFRIRLRIYHFSIICLHNGIKKTHTLPVDGPKRQVVLAKVAEKSKKKSPDGNKFLKL
jgi:hypothetical protein